MTKQTAPSDESANIIEHLRAALRRRRGALVDVDNIDIATLGGSNRTMLFDLVEGATRRRLVFRQETYTMAHTPFLSPEQQWPLLQVAFKHGLPVPEPIFRLEPADQLGRGYVVAFVAGETLPKRLLNDQAFAPARKVFLQQAGSLLARLHAIDINEVPVLDDVRDSIDPLMAQREHYAAYGEPHPVLEYAFRWLEARRPKRQSRVFLHGEFRTGNMMVDPELGLRALLDWECAHLGAPEEEFGWFCTRSWRFGHVDKPAGGFGSREELFDAYEAAGGRAIDRAAVAWWEIYGLVRWALYNVMQIYGHVHGGRRSPAFAACGRNTAFIEYDLLMTIMGKFS